MRAEAHRAARETDPPEGEGGEVLWVECPRDAWQSLARTIPTPRKVAHLRQLLGAGVRHLDLGSLVSARAVPQMADTEAVLAELDRPADADFLCIVGNERGLERALAARGVTSIGYPLSVSDTFQQRNLGRTVEASWPVVAALVAGARAGGLQLVAYVSMGFGNPYGDPWSPADTAAAVTRLHALGVRRIALADTVGNASPELLGRVLDALPAAADVGVHLHARPAAWRPLLGAALRRGVRWFEGSFGGVGGCPFAGDELVGNLPSGEVLSWLGARGFRTGVRDGALDDLTTGALELAHAYGGA